MKFPSYRPHDELTSLGAFVVPSPLHCLIGLVNKIYKSLLDVFPQAVAWPAKLHLVPQVQHGGNDFNGNASHQMLKNIAVLESLTTTRQ